MSTRKKNKKNKEVKKNNIQTKLMCNFYPLNSPIFSFSFLSIFGEKILMAQRKNIWTPQLYVHVGLSNDNTKHNWQMKCTFSIKNKK